MQVQYEETTLSEFLVTSAFVNIHTEYFVTSFSIKIS